MELNWGVVHQAASDVSQECITEVEPKVNPRWQKASAIEIRVNYDSMMLYVDIPACGHMHA